MGRDSIAISNDVISIDIATEFGPRIVGLRPFGAGNLFAELGDLGIGLTGGRRFSFRGGHRLWIAPEVPDVTYEPDDDPVRVVKEGNAAFVTGVVGDLEKTMRITIADDSARVMVDHDVANRGHHPRDVALWAITQLRVGGTALLPFSADPIDPHGLQPSTQLVGWPYTDWGALESDPGHAVLHVGGSRATPTKVGTALSRGWIAYAVGGWLFAKYVRFAASPLDLGATGQVYAGADFVELETLGVPVSLEPGQSAAHREIWRVWPAPGSLAEAIELVDSARPGELD